jgi:hypothetical protein
MARSQGHASFTPTTTVHRFTFLFAGSVLTMVNANVGGVSSSLNLVNNRR